ncbi:MAG: hypothetical protein ACREOL_06695 [Candidatus Dormibacteria bacterium]
MRIGTGVSRWRGILARPNRSRSGGFFRPQPWLRSARDLPRQAPNVVLGLVLVAVAVAIGLSAFAINQNPALPSSHSVLVSVKPSGHDRVTGGGHVIWYRSAGLLVMDLGVSKLPPGSRVSAYLVPQGGCGASLPSGARLLASARTDSQGFAHLNGELLQVSNMRFSNWSLWVSGARSPGTPAACGVISLANATLNSSG